MNKKQMNKHKVVIDDFLKALNTQTDNYVLKGGTSLMECYNLDRFSEDIDLDSTDYETIEKIVKSYCDTKGFDYFHKKDTPTVQRFTIHYGSEKPLKVEVSYRKESIDEDDVVKINGVNVYKIDVIASQKIGAYSSRDKLRDLYDVTFICNNYWDELDKKTKSQIQNAIEYKGLEHFDYIVDTQSDPLIDNDKLANDFLNMFDKLGLISDYKLSQKMPSIEDFVKEDKDELEIGIENEKYEELGRNL